MRSVSVFLLPIPLWLGACSTTASEMRRAEEAYEQARYDAARVWLTELEHRVPGTNRAMLARYVYLRGMTEYRIGHRLDALHYLALARELLEQDAHVLREEQREHLARTLADLEPREPLSYRPPPPNAD
jgi:hypothetical protein